MRLQSLRPRVASMPSALPVAPYVEAPRMTGRKLQARRLRMWTDNPHCQRCGCLTSLDNDGALPAFHLDHKVPLHKGGEDVESNCQVLCVPCHDAKTDSDLDRRPRQTA